MATHLPQLAQAHTVLDHLGVRDRVYLVDRLRAAALAIRVVDTAYYRKQAVPALRRRLAAAQDVIAALEAEADVWAIERQDLSPESWDHATVMWNLRHAELANEAPWSEPADPEDLDFDALLDFPAFSAGDVRMSTNEPKRDEHESEKR